MNNWLSTTLMIIGLFLFFFLILGIKDMDTWIFVTLLIVGLFIYLIFIVWLDWLNKCQKSSKDNNLINYISGYYMFRNKENKNEVIILDGIMGVNATHIVFANRFKDNALYMQTEISNIHGFEFNNYDENALSEYEYLTAENERTKYLIRTMGGTSVSKRMPKDLKTRMVCKISLYYENEVEDYFFFFKNTPKNIERINEIQRGIHRVKLS